MLTVPIKPFLLWQISEVLFNRSKLPAISLFYNDDEIDDDEIKENEYAVMRRSLGTKVSREVLICRNILVELFLYSPSQ